MILDDCVVIMIGRTDDDLIVVHEDPKFPGYFVLPGGKVERLEETPFRAARREWYEETGYPISEVYPIPFYTGWNHDDTKAMIGYRVELIGRPAMEWDGPEGPCRLVTFDEALKRYYLGFVMAFQRVVAAWRRNSR